MTNRTNMTNIQHPEGNTSKPSFISRIIDKTMAVWNYVSAGVWTDPRKSWKIDVVKTLNLSARSFMSSDLQNKAAAMTYQTILALVPALALLFAIARGFGFQNLIKSQLFNTLSSQQRILEVASNYVDSYLAQSSEGLFVGVGIVFLLWTLISLLGNVESMFNNIWNVTSDRTIWRKLTDYLAICLVLPVLMICSSGINIMMSSAMQKILPEVVFTPVMSFLLDLVSWVFSWLFFSGVYLLIPNAKVKILNALIAGLLAAVGFQVVQWLFVSGQMYVSKYNAIYGSFSFLPLFLIWLQLVWLITLTGAVICYSSQNIFRFSFEKQIDNISGDYRRRVTLGIFAIIVQRFEKRKPALTPDGIAAHYKLPPRLVDETVNRLIANGLIQRVSDSLDDVAERAVQPTGEYSDTPAGEILSRIETHGDSGFIPGFDTSFPGVNSLMEALDRALISTASDITIGKLRILPDDGIVTPA